MSSIADNLQRVRRRIDRAALDSGRDPSAIRLIAVSKSFPQQAVAEAVAAGQRDFGESYVQEAIVKIEALAAQRALLQWHFIGPLQSNKARPVAERFDWVHSVDRLKIAQRLSELRPAQLPPLQVCIQVNIDGQASKHGVAPADAPALARAVAGLPRLRLRGLMSIPAPMQSAAGQREVFGRVAALAAQLRDEGIAVDTLSMGMSDDLEPAVAAGATMVRVGTAIFGRRW
ncbi:YggS family pyridoxal phosphate-dependent enzyme [Pigmentiphaga soli]|uniref:Pyridoxal phosphate homeostasis protein n=1 Tax=Pigmentiphaga soli TaxID=1007095 RepID=A0ABP8GXD7_9BURK